ncbi:MCE family protein [Mycobacterium sp. ACS4331]|uniref:MCE family protein n=1 Tax=Mycobacterium sp. ACS4331 TaxID=1834121 RepID=UPI0007FBDA3C|nr:MCE family protein [Mycobacterium sp. ACS4331]OBF29732.1 mammalian cell entry protein [Mycobacterium sp. ACS4331]
MKPFHERNLALLGAITVVGVGLLTVGAYNYDRLPIFSDTTTYAAYFEELGGLTTGAPVQVSGAKVGVVESIDLEPDGVLVRFGVADDIHLGDRSEASIKTKSLLGNKVLEVSPRGDGSLTAPIPMDRTVSPYQLPDAIGDLTATVSGLDTTQLSTALQTLTETLDDTPEHLKVAVAGVSRLSTVISERDAQLRNLLQNARRATVVLGERTGQVVGLIRDTNELLAQLRTQSAALDEISTNITALVNEIKGVIADNRENLKPTLEKLSAVLTIIENRKDEVQKSIRGFATYAMALGESLGSGPFFKAYLSNLLPGQFVQPFIDAAFSDLGLDPNVLLPSERNDPQVGAPASPALPIPYPRTGQGGEPHMTLPDAITGNPDDPRYPYREPIPAPPPGGPPPGPPAPPTPDASPDEDGQ